MGKTKFSNASGFTLIEVLISTLILGMVLTVTFTALTTYRNVWEKSDTLFADVFTMSRYKILVRQSIESIYSYYVTEKTGEKKEVYFPLFKGSDKKIEFVTLSSVFDDGFPAAAELTIEQNKYNKYDIIYKEAPLVDFYIKYADDQLEYSKKIKVYKNLNKAGFRYYGVFDIIFHPEQQKSEFVCKWDDHYFSRKRGRLPEILELEIDSDRNGKEKLTFYIKSDSSYKHGLFNPPF